LVLWIRIMDFVRERLLVFQDKNKNTKENISLKINNL